MAKRQDLVQGMEEIFGADWFAYAGYRERPNHLPYAIYIEIPNTSVYAENTNYIKIRRFVIRMVTAHKDWNLEEKVEDLFDSLELGYEKVADEPAADEKDHIVEWEVEMID